MERNRRQLLPRQSRTCMRKTFVFSWLAVLCLSAQQAFQSNVPDTLRVPSTQKLILQAHGVGDQIYTCKAVDEKYAWTLKAPDAQLLASDGHLRGHHFAGPTWQAEDGSRVTGKPAASVPSPDPQSVPWLRLDATGHEGTGVMTQVVSIQRLNTKGGKAPTNGCDSSRAGAETRVHYEADYYFYSNGK